MQFWTQSTETLKNKRYLQSNKTLAASALYKTHQGKYTFKKQFGLKIEIRDFRQFSGETARDKIQIYRKEMLGKIKANT